jgi:hypothetical protein
LAPERGLRHGYYLIMLAGLLTSLAVIAYTSSSH